MEFSQKKATPLPHQINRDTPVFHDAEESPQSSQNTQNKGWWQMTWGWSRYHHGWREQGGNGLCFMGQVLEPLASKIPVQCWWDHTEKSLNMSSSTASSVTKGKGERVRQEHPSWGLLGHPTRALGGPGQDRAGNGPMGHRRDGGKLQCETRALPAPLEQERQRKEPAECASLGKHSWVEPPDPQGDEIVQDHPLQDCPWSTGGIRGLVQISVCNPSPSAPATVDSGCSVSCWVLSIPGSMQA